MWIIFFNKCIEIFSVLFPFFIVKCVLADVFVNWLINLLIKCILVYVLLKIISFIWRCYYCREELQIWAFARRLTKDFEQGGIFIVPHPLRHLISYFIYYFAFSSQGPPPFTTNMVLRTQILTELSLAKRRVI